MPWTAMYKGKEKGAFQVPRKTDVECPTCGGRMRVWSEGTDGTARHFKHIGGMGNGKGGESKKCESVSESQQHIKWKNLAAERLHELFEDNERKCRVEMPLNAPMSDRENRQGDAVIMLEEYDEQLGQGVVVEVQHKNESKDIGATNSDYINQDLSVIWADKSDFANDRFRLAEVDIRKRAKDLVWPDYVPTQSTWWDPPHNHKDAQEKWQSAVDTGLVNPGSPATLPPEWNDDMANKVWEGTSWDAILSRQSEVYDNHHAGKHIVELATFNPNHHRKVEAKFTERMLDTLYYQTSDWENIVGKGTPTLISRENSPMTATVPLNYWIATEGPTERLKLALQHAHARNAEKVPNSAKQRKEVLSRIPTIVHYNTGKMQRQAIPERVVKQIASHAGMDGGATEWALQRLVVNGDLNRTDDGRYELA